MIATLFLAAAVQAEPVEVRDDLGRVVRLDRPARRIVALYGAFNEMLHAMHLGDLLVARTDADRFPPEISMLPSIGTHMRPNVERIVGLGPDLVLQMGGRREALQSVEQLERFGVTTAMFRVSSFQELFNVIERLGALTDHTDRSAALVASMRARLDAVEQRLPPGGATPRVFFEVRSGNLLAAGKDSVVTDIIRAAGGRNCVSAQRKLVRLGDEELLRLAPEVYLSQRGPMNPAPRDVRSLPRFATLPCVLNDRVYDVDEQVFSRPGPRNVDAVEILAAILYPDHYPEFASKAGQLTEKINE